MAMGGSAEAISTVLKSRHDVAADLQTLKALLESAGA